MKIKIFITVLALFIISTSNVTSFAKGDGKLAFYNYHTEEALEVTYRTGEKYNKKGLEQIQRLFRSRSDEKEHLIDPMLIELLDNIQDHFNADCLELISGYRSPELNRQLKNSGANVAEESMHLEGKAADIHIDEVTEDAVADYARSLKAGGVGFYPAWDFVHVDTGDVRKWDLPDKPGRLLTAFRKGDKWQITTDKNIYFPKEEIPIETLNITRTPKTFNEKLILEHFIRGKWEKIADLNICAGTKLGAGKTCTDKWEPKNNEAFGKFRILIDGSTRSNEFYRKKM